MSISSRLRYCAFLRWTPARWPSGRACGRVPLSSASTVARYAIYAPEVPIGDIVLSVNGVSGLSATQLVETLRVAEGETWLALIA